MQKERDMENELSNNNIGILIYCGTCETHVCVLPFIFFTRSLEGFSEKLAQNANSFKSRLLQCLTSRHVTSTTLRTRQ